MKRFALLALLLAATSLVHAQGAPACADITGTWNFDQGGGHLNVVFTLTQDNSQNPPSVSGNIDHVWTGSQYAGYTLDVGGQTPSTYNGSKPGGAQYTIVGYNAQLNSTYGGTIYIPFNQVGCGAFTNAGGYAYRTTCPVPSSETQTFVGYQFNNAAAGFTGTLTGTNGYSFDGRTVQSVSSNITGGSCPNFMNAPIIDRPWWSYVSANKYGSPPVGFDGDTVSSRTWLGDMRSTKSFTQNGCFSTYTETLAMDCPASNVPQPQITWTPYGSGLTDTIGVLPYTVTYKRSGTISDPPKNYGYTDLDMNAWGPLENIWVVICHVTGLC